MFPTSEMVNKARQQLERLYSMTAEVIVDADVKDPETGIITTKRQSVGMYPCRVSYKTSTTGTGEGVANFAQFIVLFICPEVNIPQGARITVTQGGRVSHYKAASVAAVYDTHQEIQLKRLERH